MLTLSHQHPFFIMVCRLSAVVKCLSLPSECGFCGQGWELSLLLCGNRCSGTTAYLCWTICGVAALVDYYVRDSHTTCLLFPKLCKQEPVYFSIWHWLYLGFFLASYSKSHQTITTHVARIWWIKFFNSCGKNKCTFKLITLSNFLYLQIILGKSLFSINPILHSIHTTIDIITSTPNV